MNKTKIPYNKNTAFKAVIVLVLIGAILGALLAILNDVLFVSPEERTMRIIKAFYDGQEMAYTEIELQEADATNQFGSVKTVYCMQNGDYSLKATGNEGFHGGTVTMWLLVAFDGGEFKEFIKVKYAESEGQTLMSNFSDEYYDAYVGGDIKNGYFTIETGNTNTHFVAGTTKSSNAINNAINSAYYYIVNVLEVQNEN